MPVATHRGNTSFLPFMVYVSTPVSFLIPKGLGAGITQWPHTLEKRTKCRTLNFIDLCLGIWHWMTEYRKSCPK